MLELVAQLYSCSKEGHRRGDSGELRDAGHRDGAGHSAPWRDFPLLAVG